MRIVSLLPALTELVCALGRREDLVGVTHECDFPRNVAELARLTRSRLPDDATSAQIDALVAEQANGLFDLDEARLGELAPDLILTQEQCDVCAVNEATVRRVAAKLAGKPHVESVDPRTLDEIFAMFRRVGDLLERPLEAEHHVAGFHRTIRWIREFIAPTRPKPRVLLLEWLDPPYSCGHWNPEIVELAGGREMIGRPGERSRRVTWEEIVETSPEVLILALCGLPLDRAEREAAAIVDRPEWRELPAVRDGRVALVDGSSFFTRPGPRLEVSLRIAAAAITPHMFAASDTRRGQAWKFLEPPN
ncbi:cobalamin-binding protein [Paludisphaera rhizosphaerae]|uniref:cobalamin-binding protein n=1 Tax=Paludisphaera rhizosphaerae TaxID=2711216 RepID=UPI0013ED7A49|nr:cobalamin-binding protein [Paludisphaera rhizosphaerae]